MPGINSDYNCARLLAPKFSPARNAPIFNGLDALHTTFSLKASVFIGEEVFISRIIVNESQLFAMEAVHVSQSRSSESGGRENGATNYL